MLGYTSWKQSEQGCDRSIYVIGAESMWSYMVDIINGSRVNEGEMVA
jgi:hypothetical protein